MFLSELKIVSVISVPLWWIFRIPAVGEDACFSGHGQTLRIQFTIHASLFGCFIIIQTQKFAVK